LKDRRVYAALFAVQFFFATLPIAVKIVLRDLSAPGLALLRVAGASAVFLVLQRTLVGERVRTRRDWATLALYALFGVVANQLLYLTALTLTTATDAQTMMAAGPAIALLVAIVLRRERGSAPKWAGIAMAGSGAAWLVGQGFGHGGGVGNLLALANVACYSTYLVLSRGLARRYDALTVITWVFCIGMLGIAPWGLASLLTRGAHLSPAGWGALAWIVLGPTVGGYYLNVWALKRVESSVVALWVYLQPVMTALMAVPVLGEHPSPRLLPAALLIFAGVAVTELGARRARRGSAPSPAEQDHAQV
jgi:drug/metabolite transporter (DMT)-like permease